MSVRAARPPQPRDKPVCLRKNDEFLLKTRHSLL
jgi:hypothetical protein